MDDVIALINAYREEAGEFIDRLSTGVGELAIAPDELRDELTQDLLRTAHNLKGGAQSVGDEEVARLAHALEEALAECAAVTEPPSLDQLDQLSTLAQQLSLQADAGLGADSAEQIAARMGFPLGDSSTKRPSDPGPEEVRLRVAGRRLDRLMTSAEELLVTHARFQVGQQRLGGLHRALQRLIDQERCTPQALEDLSQQLARTLQDERRVVADFGQLAQEMNRAMKRVRMLPLRDYVPLWRRILREAATTAGREVELEAAVGDLELDKHLMDNLRDPFMHLLRNAVGHGIEPPAEREAAGKPPRGRIRVSAAMEGSRVRLEISDDGRGLGIDRIRRRAADQGLASEEALAAMDPTALQELIFRDGFSTSEQANQLSGRGVGMSVVQRQVERLGGSVTVRTSASGTTFALNLPPSILSVAGLLVRTPQAVYALPVDHVVRTVRLDPRRTGPTVDGLVFRLPQSEETVRVVALESLLGTPGADVSAADHVVMLERRGRRLGLLVDEIIGQQEFVTRPLPWNVGALPGIGGATVLSDRGAALVLDVVGLLDLASRSGSGASSSPPTPGGHGDPAKAEAGAGPEAETDAHEGGPAKGSGSRDAKRVLVVDDAHASRTLARNMLANAGYQVETSVDGAAAWQRLTTDRFDLLVTDIQMPRMDGLELTRQVREHPRLSALPVILVTSLGQPREVERGAEVGADEYIVKGQFDQRRLVEAVRRLV